MATKRRGFNAIVLNDDGGDLAELRRGIRRDMRRAMRRVDDDAKKGETALSETLKAFSTIDAWNKWTQAQTNIVNRMSRLSSFVETTGNNAGRVVVPTTWNDKAQRLFSEVLDGYFDLSMNVYNGFSADRAITLWGFLANSMGMGGLGESMLGAVLFLGFTGNGLYTQSMMPGLGGFNANGLILPRLVSAQIAVIA